MKTYYIESRRKETSILQRRRRRRMPTEFVAYFIGTAF
jgi:hypothetical protein